MLLFNFGAASVVVAQPGKSSPSRAPKWEIAFHAGFDGTTNPRGGLATPFPAAPTLEVGGAFAPSRRIPSWFFGEGAAVFNAARTQILGVPPPIAPLDDLFERASTHRTSGAVFGARIARWLNARYALEFSFDVGTGTMALTPETLETIEVTRASFVPAFATLFGARLTDGHARATIVEQEGRHLVATGALVINLMQSDRFAPYAVVGGGIDSPRGEAAEVALDGMYEFRTALAMSLIRETDTVTIQYESARSLVMMFGGGFRWDLSPRSGLRGEVRVHLGSNGPHVLVSTAATNVRLEGPPTAVLFVATPSLLFSGSTTLMSTLSGSAVERFEAFRTSALWTRAAITFGYFLRF